MEIRLLQHGKERWTDALNDSTNVRFMDKRAEIVDKVLMVGIQLVQKFHGFDCSLAASVEQRLL
jgi:hypothetical protein